MKAISLEDGIVFHANYADPTTRDCAESVIVRVLKAGICETDLQLCQGYMGFRGVLGHEFVGIAETGPFSGKRVVGEINCYCHNCDFCQRGLKSHCPNRTVIGILNHDGAFAERLIVPQRNLHLVPDNVSDDEAVFVEPVAAACRIPEQVSVSAGDRVIVLGDGRLGNLCAQVLNHHGCQVTVVGKHSYKLDLLRSLNIDTVLLNDIGALPAADVVVDCTGSPSGLPTALQMVRPCGTIVLKTTVAAEQTMHMAPIVIDEIRIIGSRCGPFADALGLLSSGAVQVRPLISDRFPLEDCGAAFERATQKDALKVLFDIG
ncbi:MAG: alcohol dehydrogenase catalytic domain-containing protein [Planctomycetaceae bacterium]|nr:alcohol dehydrogenase catalytic domain-containing protein [Planctomycetaceae bacterium]